MAVTAGAFLAASLNLFHSRHAYTNMIGIKIGGKVFKQWHSRVGPQCIDSLFSILKII